MVEDSVEPLERSVEMELDPTRSRRHSLPSILGTPAFDEAQSDSAHPRQLVNSLETLLKVVGVERADSSVEGW